MVSRFSDHTFSVFAAFLAATTYLLLYLPPLTTLSVSAVDLYDIYCD